MTEPSQPIGRLHAEQTQDHYWEMQSIPDRGKRALRTAHNMIPTRDVMRAEWFCELLLDVVRGDISIETAQEKLVEKWK